MGLREVDFNLHVPHYCCVVGIAVLAAVRANSHNPCIATYLIGKRHVGILPQVRYVSVLSNKMVQSSGAVCMHSIWGLER